MQKERRSQIVATKRMFALEIIDDQAFTDKSSSAQALYFHLGMIADDEGFVNNPKNAQAKAHASDDDLRVLTAKNFVIFIRDGLVVITDWKANNYIQKDRFKPTRYQEEKNLLECVNGKYRMKPTLLEGNEPYNDSCIQNVSIDKNREDKNRIEKISLDKNKNQKENESEIIENKDDPFNPDDDLPF